MNLRTMLAMMILLAGSLRAGNNEFRAVWVITWEHINSGLTAEQNKANIREILDNVKTANMNAVLWQVRQGGTAYYNSSYEPWGRYAGYSDPGYDPLAYAIEEAHKRGLELHAWFNTFQVSDTSPGTIAAEHPEWICTNIDGQAMPAYRAASPGMQAVRDYTVKVAMEIVRNYDIDGFHLDYVRWNEYDEDDMVNVAGISMEEQLNKMDGELSEERVQRLAKSAGTKRYIYDTEHPYSATPPEGYDTWDNWRRAGVTKFVKQLHDSIQAVKPWVRLSPAALGKYNWSGWNGYEVVFQDAALWYNEGYIDQLMLMSYHWTTGNGFKGMLQDDCPNCWKDYTAAGRAAGRMFTPGPGSYVLDENNVWNNHPDIVYKSRQVDFVDGFQFFSYGSWEGHDYWEAAGTSFFANRKKVKPLTYMNSDQPGAPVIQLSKTGDLSYKIDVSVPANETARYAIYRSEDGVADTDSDKILDIVYADQDFSYTDQLSGLQDYNGQYHYFVTTLSRYWIESAVSNTETSDSVLSLPPTVIATSPVDSGEISIGTGLRFDFSKTMSGQSLDSLIHFSPAVNFKAAWGSNNKYVTISFPDLLAKAESYTVVIDSVLSDVNGRLLDGNADSTEGDSYLFHFSTKGDDDIRPLVKASYPAEGEKIDSEDIFTFWFNEPLLEDSITTDKMALYQGNTFIETKFFYRKTGEQSSLSIKATEALSPDTKYTLFLDSSLVDTAGNAFADMIIRQYHTSQWHHSNTRKIDDFAAPAAWWQPSGSGSTTGIMDSKTTWGFSKKAYIPGPNVKKSAYLKYAWDVSAQAHLIREYLPPSDPKNIEFDSTYTMQVYIFGDGSGTLFRFAVDEYYDGKWQDTEVSQWITIDWIGWRLVEWKLTDPNSVGSWISSNEEISGNKFRMDSFQFDYVPGESAASGLVYLDEFRVVQKSNAPVGITERPGVPVEYTLGQNYPNPFNPVTTISYSVPQSGRVRLLVYDMQGREVVRLVDGFVTAGNHAVRFNGNKLASGSYIYRLETGEKVLTRKMLLIK